MASATSYSFRRGLVALATSKQARLRPAVLKLVGVHKTTLVLQQKCLGTFQKDGVKLSAGLFK